VPGTFLSLDFLLSYMNTQKLQKKITKATKISKNKQQKAQKANSKIQIFKTYSLRAGFWILTARSS